jgi:hypothetical protein
MVAVKKKCCGNSLRCTFLFRGINLRMSELARSVHFIYSFSGPFLTLSPTSILILASRDSVIGIATGYRLDSQGIGVRVPLREEFFFSPRCPDAFWGPCSLTSNRNREAIFPGVKWPEREADHLLEYGA